MEQGTILNNIFSSIDRVLNDIDIELKNPINTDQRKESIMVWKDLMMYAKVVLTKKTFPHLPTGILNNLNTSIGSINTTIITNVNGYFSTYSSIMSLLKSIPVINKGDAKINLKLLLEDFHSQAEKLFFDFKQGQNTELKKWEEEKKSWEDDLSTLAEKSNTMSLKLDKFSSKLETEEKNHQDLLLTFKEKASSFRLEQEEKFKELVSELENKFKQKIEDLDSYTQQTKEHLEQRKKEIEVLWGIIGKATVSGQSQSYADKAKALADKLMWTAFILMTLMMGTVAILTIIDILKSKFSFEIFFYKVLATSVLLVPAFYCMNLAKRQRDREFQLRDFEVKTAALEPFMERLTFIDEQSKLEKDKTKLELTKTFFDKEFAKENKQHKDILIPQDVLASLKELSKIVKSCEK